MSGYPTSFFNGVDSNIGGSSVDQGLSGIQAVYDSYISDLTAEQARIAGQVPFLLYLQGNVGPDNPAMTLTVITSSGYPREVNAVFIITEEHIPVSAPNGQIELNHVARAHLATIPLTLTAAGSTLLNAAFSGSVPHVIDRKSVV